MFLFHNSQGSYVYSLTVCNFIFGVSAAENIRNSPINRNFVGFLCLSAHLSEFSSSTSPERFSCGGLSADSAPQASEAGFAELLKAIYA
jgi:hypothetical protein